MNNKICTRCLHDHLCYCGVEEGEDLGFCCECDDLGGVCGPWSIGQETQKDSSGYLTI